MNAEPRRMRFGVFLGPYHRFGVNPNLAMQRDLELASHLERLGFDEIWYGEHHSGGVETIASPELMIAAALSAPRGSDSAPECLRCRITSRSCWPIGSFSSIT